MASMTGQVGSGTGTGAKPRTVALIGPYGSGKSSLFEHLLAAAGSPVRRAQDVRDRPSSTEIAVGHCSFMGDPWAVIDCPGSLEFAFETQGALAQADIAVVVCEPAPERALTVAPFLKWLEDADIPHILFLNKIETFAGRVRDTLAALQPYSHKPLVLRQVPIRNADDVITGYVDVVSERAYRYRDGLASELIEFPAALRPREEEALAGLVEVLADHDDVLLEKVVEDIRPTADEIYRQLHKDLASDAIVEVLLGAAEHDHGVRRLWKALRHDGPSPEETARRRGIKAEGEPLVQIFKTVYAPHAGKLSYARVWRGTVADGMALAGARVGGVHMLPGGELQKVPHAMAGQIVALGRLEAAATGMALCPSSQVSGIAYPAPPAAVFSLAIKTGDRKDEVKLSGALQKLTEEDPSLSLVHNGETGEMLLHGQGETHLHAALDKVTKGYKLELTPVRPQIAFRETIRRPVKQHSRLKRQTGGHGQFADIAIEIAPRGRGEGFRFVDEIVGGAIPRQYIPAVGEAAEDSLRKGPLGYPVVDVQVRLVDGTFHSVDSSDMAFKSVTRSAMAEGLAKAEPMLLEPIDLVRVSVPNAFTAAAQRLLTGRRGQILGYAERPEWPGWDDVEALVPEAELHDLIVELRSRTMGVGSFVARFDHLAEAPGRLVERAQQRAQAARA